MAEERVMFRFSKRVAIDEIEGTLRLACLAVESLHGTERVQLEARYAIARAHRTVTITVMNDVGKTLALVFSGYARREYGEQAVAMGQAVGRRRNSGAAGNQSSRHPRELTGVRR